MRDAWIDELTDELMRYCGPVFVAGGINSYPGEIKGGGTYALIDTGEKRLLVTCYHVWEYYLDRVDADPQTTFGLALAEGDKCISFKQPKRHLLAADRDLDLAVFEFDPQEAEFRRNKSWFKISNWPIPKVGKGEYVVTLGFPGELRKAQGMECTFGCIAMPFKVTDTSDRTIAAFCDEENLEVFGEMKDSLGGMSGSPTYRISDNDELNLVGFARLGALESGAPNRKYQSSPESALSAAVFFTHASFLEPDGKLRGSGSREGCVERPSLELPAP